MQWSVFPRGKHPTPCVNVRYANAHNELRILMFMGKIYGVLCFTKYVYKEIMLSNSLYNGTRAATIYKKNITYQKRINWNPFFFWQPQL